MGASVERAAVISKLRSLSRPAVEDTHFPGRYFRKGPAGVLTARSTERRPMLRFVKRRKLSSGRLNFSALSQVLLRPCQFIGGGCWRHRLVDRKAIRCLMGRL